MIHCLPNAPDAAELRVLPSMFKARKRVFIDLLHWDLPAIAVRFELDEFDMEPVTYLVLNGEARRELIAGYCLVWLKPYENQWLAYPPAIARRFSPELAALVGYRQHRPNLGNHEGLCPSVLLGKGPPQNSSASDALRLAQAAAVAEHAASQRGGG